MEVAPEQSRSFLRLSRQRKPLGTIAVISRGAPPDALVEALFALGLEVVALEVADVALARTLARLGPEIVFPLCSLILPQGGTVPGLVEAVLPATPCVGSGSRATALALHRLDALEKFRTLGFPVPDGVCFLPQRPPAHGPFRTLLPWESLWLTAEGRPDYQALLDRLGTPLVLAPVLAAPGTPSLQLWEEAPFAAAIAALAETAGPLLVEGALERHESGVSYAVAVLEAEGKAPLALPVQLLPANGALAESATGASRPALRPVSSPKLDRALRQAAVVIHQVFGCQDYSLVEFCLDRTWQLVPLQVTPQPGLCPGEDLFPQIVLAQTGRPYVALVARLLARAIRSRPLAGPADTPHVCHPRDHPPTPPRVPSSGGLPPVIGTMDVALVPPSSVSQAGRNASEMEAATRAGPVCFAGVRAALPLAGGIVPVVLAFGVLAHAAGLSVLAAQAMSALVFSGAQLVALQMLVVAAPVPLILAAGVLLNLRHLVYSAALAPHLAPVSRAWRCLLAYLLTDETFALASRYFQQSGKRPHRQWYLLGAGLPVWLACQAGTLLGTTLGAHLPTGWSLDFVAPLSLLALLALSVQVAPRLISALLAGFVAVAAVRLPLNLSVLVAALAGSTAGLVLEAWRVRRARPGRKEIYGRRLLGGGRHVGRGHLRASLSLFGDAASRAAASAPTRLAPGAHSDSGGAGSERTGPHWQRDDAHNPAATRGGRRHAAAGVADQEYFPGGLRRDGDAVAVAATAAPCLSPAAAGPVPPGARRAPR